MSLQANTQDKYYRDAHPALYSLLSAVAMTVRANQVCLVSPDSDPDCVILASSGDPEYSEDRARYSVGGQDVSAEVIYGEHVLGRLEVTAPKEPVDKLMLEAFAAAAGQILGELRRVGAASHVQEQQTASELRGQRAILERVIENFPGVLLVIDPDGWRVVTSNSGLSRYVAPEFHNPQSVRGRTLREISSNWSAGSEELLVLMANSLKTGQSATYEGYESQNPHAGTAFFNWSIVPIKYGDNDPGLVLLSAHDITDAVVARKRAQASAELARARAEELEAVINHIVDGVSIINAAGHTVKINPAGQALLGRGVIGDVGPEDHARAYGLHTTAGEPLTEDSVPALRSLKGETVVGEQLVVRRPNGEELFISASTAPLRDAEGRISGAVGVFHDITKEKLLERLKDEFLSVVSHELRTPLSAITGYSDLLLRGIHGGLTERQARSLKAIRANADRLLHLINDLLDVSRLESGSMPLDFAAVSLPEVVSRTVAQTRVIASEAGVSIENKVGRQKLPRLWGDETKLQQVIENLLSNAVKFTPAGGKVTFEACVSPLAADDAALPASLASDYPEGASPRSVILSTVDTGAGLEHEQLARIWDRFYQVDTSSKRRSGGAGLGLAIVRNLVERQGGQVWAESNGTNRGSAFRFSIPLAEESNVPEAEPQDDRRTENTQPRRKYIPGETPPGGNLVLVVEDDADQREIICDMLEMEGYSVALVPDEELALEEAVRLQPAAVILDVILPGTDGWEVLQGLRGNPQTREIPVLIISVVDQPDFGKKLGANEYLLKPLQPVALRETVRRLIRRPARS